MPQPLDSVPITVRFFSFAAERMGAREVSEQVEAGATVEEVLARYLDRLGASRDRFLVAVNDEWADPARQLQPGDVLAIIPPVAGG